MSQVVPSFTRSYDRSQYVRPSLFIRFVTALAILIPLVAVFAAPALAWGWAFDWVDLTLLVGLYLLTMLGITVGFHRLFVHRSFQTNMFMKIVWGVLGSMAVQGPLFQWVGTHRRHHQFSDTVDDAHSPHHHGEGIMGLLRGIWYSHIGWFFAADPPHREHYIKDLNLSPTLRLVSKLFPLWVTLGLVIPAVLGGLLTQSWYGAATGFFWGGLVRIFLVQHVVFSINSACHLWGRKPFKCNDESRNNTIFGVLCLGEGWHNTHHAFPTSARHGLQWWELDISYWVIIAMSKFGLAWNIKLPHQEARERAMRG